VGIKGFGHRYPRISTRCAGHALEVPSLLPAAQLAYQALAVVPAAREPPLLAKSHPCLPIGRIAVGRDSLAARLVLVAFEAKKFTLFPKSLTPEGPRDRKNEAK